MLSGGAPLRVTHDDGDHEFPRWTPTAAQSSTTRARAPGEPGMLWEVSALGGQPRPLVSSAGGADCSHDGRPHRDVPTRDDRAELMTFASTTAEIERMAHRPLWVHVRVAALVA